MTQIFERNPLQVLRIIEEGAIATRSYKLAECCRLHNISQDQYHKIRKEYVLGGTLIEFPSKESALQYLRGDYDACLKSLWPTPQPNQESKPMSTKAQRKLGRLEGQAMHGLDPELVECIAIDLLENPSMTNAQIAERRQVSDATVYRIRKANHPKLSDKFREMLMVEFNGMRASPQVIEWLSEINRDPPQPESNESPIAQPSKRLDPIPNIVVRPKPLPEPPSETEFEAYVAQKKKEVDDMEETKQVSALEKMTTRQLIPYLRKAMRRDGYTHILDLQAKDNTPVKVKREEEIVM